jgi:hypothetical protein
MSKPCDFLDDPNQQKFYTLERLHGIPDFVKNASTATQREGVDKLPVHIFGDPHRRKFPCHTKAATWLSQAYFTLCEESYSKKEADLVQGRIEKAAEHFGISGTTNAFKRHWRKLAGLDKKAVADKDYGLIVDYEGKQLKMFPMPNALSVKMAGEYLYANRFKYPYAWRCTAARNILKKAAEYDQRWKNGEKIAGAELGVLRFDSDTREYLEKAAGFGAAFPEHVAEKIAQRVLMLGDKHKGLKVKLAQVAKIVSNLSVDACTPEFIQKTAAALDAVDRESGICNHYHHGVDLPEEALFQLVAKQAQQIKEGFITLTTGNTYPVEALKHLPVDKIASVMGQELVDAILTSDGMHVDTEKAAEILPTLPRTDAALLERVLGEFADQEFNKTASLKNNPFTKQPGEDPFSRENMLDFFKKRGHHPKDIKYTLAVPYHHGKE